MHACLLLVPAHTVSILILGWCLQHCGGEPEQAKGANGMQLYVVDCIVYIVDAKGMSVCLYKWHLVGARADANEIWKRSKC